MPAKQTGARASRLEQELNAARRVSEALWRHVHVEDLVEEALNTALQVVGAEAGAVLLHDPHQGRLVFRHVMGGKASLLKDTAIPANQGIAGEVFTTGNPYITPDAGTDRHHLKGVDDKTGYRTKDMIAVPLKRWEGQPIGVLEVLNKQDGRLSEEDLGILTIIAALTAAAVEQARLFEETKLAQMVRLLAEISHDVSNLLTPVLSGLGLLQANLSQFFVGLPKHEAKEAYPTRQLCDEVLSLMRSNTRRIKEQVREMANCVKGMTTPPQFETCDVNLVVRNVFDTLRLLADENKISLRSDGLASLPTILADERRLYLAFYNLVNNAIPEVPTGGSIVVKGWTDSKDDSVRITVTDTGRGMPAEVREKLFTPAAISRKEGGTGLGTKIVKDIVVAHGGEISVESEEGTGTTFLIRLPVRPNPDHSSRAAAEPDDAGALTPPPGSSPRSRP